MKLPLPTNRLVSLALIGGIVAAGASVALAVPGFLAPAAPDLPPGAPQEDPGFTPAVQEQSFRGEHEEHEEHEDDDD